MDPVGPAMVPNMHPVKDKAKEKFLVFLAVGELYNDDFYALLALN